ncbi:hypothetical protein [Sphingomonas beigongshangi]|uniref:hypothetical protein n=1 Tax=Sphingomonas beigongshangi TaxID=2782540 RepID=UPI001FEFF976|nr:hypothetical protein [Sphingomonas beigongshangi]
MAIDHQAVEQHLSRRLARKTLDAASGRVEADLQGVERKHVADRQDELIRIVS